MDPPCDQCPRGGPQNEQRYTLSNRNWQAFKLWNKIKASRGTYRVHPKVADSPIFADVMWIIERNVKRAKDAIKAKAIRRAREEAEMERLRRQGM